MRWPAVVAFLGAALCVWLLTRVVQAMALRYKLRDRDEGRGHIKHRSVPRVGGVAIATGFGLTVLVLNLVGVSTGPLGKPLVWLAASLIFAVGFVDDLRSMRAELKLVAVLAAGALVALAGYRIENVPFVDIPIEGAWSVGLTALWFAVIGTAWNFIDGLDGLASGLTITASLAFWFGGLGPEVHLPAILAGAALGFLAHNRHPSTIFMGDCGSFFLGFWIALSGLIAARGGTTVASSTAVLVALAWPLADLGWALYRRARRSALFQASGDHLHYVLNARLGHRGAVQLAVLLAGMMGVTSVIVSRSLLSGLGMAICSSALLVFAGRVRVTRQVMVAMAALGLWLARESVVQAEATARKPPANERREGSDR